MTQRGRSRSATAPARAAAPPTEPQGFRPHPLTSAIHLKQVRPGQRDTPEYTDAEADAKGDGEGWRVVETPARYRTTATPALALALGTAEYPPLFVYDRLLSGPAGQRIAHRLYLPFATCAEVAALEHNPYREPGELYGLLAGHYGQLSFTETVRARMPTPTTPPPCTSPPAPRCCLPNAPPTPLPPVRWHWNNAGSPPKTPNSPTPSLPNH